MVKNAKIKPMVLKINVFGEFGAAFPNGERMLTNSWRTFTKGGRTLSKTGKTLTDGRRTLSDDSGMRIFYVKFKREDFGIKPIFLPEVTARVLETVG